MRLLGSAWPIIYPEFEGPVSYAGMLWLIMAAGTVVSNLQSDRMTKWIGTGKVMVILVAMTAIALFGFKYYRKTVPTLPSDRSYLYVFHA